MLSDRKLVEPTSLGTVENGNLNEIVANQTYFTPDVLAYNDYNAFGMLKPDRNGEAGDSYRYGFNGMEKDDEVSGKGNSHTAEHWQYDSRIARRWDIDPVVKSHESPYATFANNPIWFVDPSGADSSKISGSNTWTWDVEQGDTYESISSRTGVSVENLRDWNSEYIDTKIKIGASLSISDPTLPMQKGPATATIGDGVITILNYGELFKTTDVVILFEPNLENKDSEYMWFQTLETNDPKQFDASGGQLKLSPNRTLSPMTPFDDKKGGYNLYHRHAKGNDDAINAIPWNYKEKFTAFPYKYPLPSGLHIPRGNTLGFKDRPNRPVINSGEIIWKASLVLRKKVDGNWVDVQTISYGFTQTQDNNSPQPLILQNTNNK